MNNKTVKRSFVKILLTSVTLVLLLAGCSGNNSVSYQLNNVDWAEHFRTVSEMTNSSDFIILGEVTNQSVEIRNDLAFTMSEITIVKSYGANTIPYKQTIIVLQTGGASKGVQTAPIEDVLMLRNNSSYLLFLRMTDEGHAILMGGYQGVASLIDGRISFPSNHSFDENPLNGISVNEIGNAISTLMVK